MATGAVSPTDSYRRGAVDLPGVALHYVECGAGPHAVVLLHGYTDSWRSFRLTLPGLAPACRCLALDQRGHGQSRYDGEDLSPAAFAGDVVALLDRMGIASATLVGHSMGSFIARRVALARPDRVERLVLVGSGLRVDNPAVREVEAGVAQFDGSASRPFVEEFQSSCVFDLGSVPAPFFEECVDASAGVPPRVWRAALAGMLDDDDRHLLGRIGQPTLVIGGREDGIFGREEQEELARSLPEGRLLLYDRCGHSPHWEQPGRFVEDVLRFLRETA
ncbi:alpha/beta fold hydrolase [Tautonia plasticadhaerens]|uniref:Tropinesterase n=1 Tax=Tautonia plasticadhaerens TaxID=2527974 RepID=A0A518H3X6_9BACT|nr:alpha/beta hydrolase [Tautonia plasticadhaerens]QDV35533.1 Tropinesterase [Tautonia plasticadhaerens]